MGWFSKKQHTWDNMTKEQLQKHYERKFLGLLKKYEKLEQESNQRYSKLEQESNQRYSNLLTKYDKLLARLEQLEE